MNLHVYEIRGYIFTLIALYIDILSSFYHIQAMTTYALLYLRSVTYLHSKIPRSFDGFYGILIKHNFIGEENAENRIRVAFIYESFEHSVCVCCVGINC